MSSVGLHRRLTIDFSEACFLNCLKNADFQALLGVNECFHGRLSFLLHPGGSDVTFTLIIEVQRRKLHLKGWMVVFLNLERSHQAPYTHRRKDPPTSG